MKDLFDLIENIIKDGVLGFLYRKIELVIGFMKISHYLDAVYTRSHSAYGKGKNLYFHTEITFVVYVH